MPKSSVQFPSEPMETKLLEVDTELASQEVQLAAQLEAIQEKRKSLQTVIHMFSSSDEPVSSGTPLDEAVSSAVNGFVSESPEPSAPKEKESAATHKSPKSQSPAPRSKAPKASKSAAKPSTKGATTSQKSSAKNKKSSDWQPYVRKEYRDRSLPQAVLAVLEDHPKEVVEVPSIIDAIFVDNIPKPARTSARDRLSNVLSVGLRNKKWYRGKTGLYSVSKEVADASRIS
ncbi:MAG: hypothetical protein ACFE0I_06710 [Elainellaceae cyanobacterium]